MSARQSLLVVDDTLANLRLLAEILADRDFMVRPVPDGRLSIAAAQAEPPDLILLDIMMPDLSGYEVCKILKAEARTREIPIIFISAKNEVLDKVQAFSMGAVDYITKPFQAEEVLARVETHLTLRSLQLQREEQNRTLAETLQQLKTTQEELIQREKMAALGHLIAGIAHEINTPLGAIRASITNIANALETSLAQLPLVFQLLEPSEQAVFFALIKAALSKSVHLSSRETRELRRELQNQLERAEIAQADVIARMFVNMGIYEDLTDFLPLLRHPQNVVLIQTAYHLFMQRNNSQNILLAVERASKVVFALKNYVHYDESGEKSQFNVAEGLDVVLTLYYNHLKHGVEVVTRYAEVPPISGYPDELSQVWTNLIHNAIQAMHGKGVLELAVAQEDCNVAVEITDSGPGVPVDLQQRIFEPFFTTKAAGEGSGLGLDIVNRIVARHQGKIELTSQPGRTTFRVILPIHAA